MKLVDIKVFHMDGAKDPSYETEHASGGDLCSIEDITIESKAVKLVRTGLHVAIPEGFEMQVRPRSGLALKQSVTVLNTPGTIDADYRGEIKVILANLGDKPFEITKGMRIAQGVICPVVKGIYTKVETLEDLGDTNRGAGGFGHTGTSKN